MQDNAHLYVWLGADIKNYFQPLPQFMLMMEEKFKNLGIKSNNFITMRNQKGYGKQKNWMHVRQELLHYIKGYPYFKPVYTNIKREIPGFTHKPKTEYLRPGNVWYDIKQVWHLKEENVPDCYVQKPLEAIKRIILSSSKRNDLIYDFFSHSGTTLLAVEITGRRAFVCDISPVFAEITIRRLERYRNTGKIGWKCDSPFPEVEL